MLPDNENSFDASGQVWLDQLVMLHENDASQLLQILIEVQERFGHIPHLAVTRLANKLSIPRARIESVSSFYSFLHLKPHGKYRVLFSDNITDRMLGSQELMEQMCRQLWLQPGKVSEDGLVSIGTTSCTGMCDQGPAMLVNGRAITRLTHQRVLEIAQLIRNRTPLEDWPADYFKVEDNIRRSGLAARQYNCLRRSIARRFVVGRTIHHRIDQGIRPARTRRRRFFHRAEMGGLSQCAGFRTLRGLQRRRRRAGHVQGSRAAYSTG